MEDITDEQDKGKWVEFTDSEFENQLGGLFCFLNDREGIDGIDWNSLNYQVYDADYYSEKFPGLDPAVYEILAESTKIDKVIDNRDPPLQIKHEPTTVKFD
jgi:hypothetical protein